MRLFTKYATAVATTIGLVGASIASAEEATFTTPLEARILQQFGQAAATNLDRHISIAKQNAAQTLARLILNPPLSPDGTPDYTKGTYIETMQGMVNEIACPTGYKCQSPELKIKTDNIAGPKTAFAVLDVLTQAYGTGFFSIRQNQLQFFTGHLKGHEWEAQMNERLSQLYSAALRNGTNGFLASIKSSGVDSEGYILYPRAGINFYDTYKAAKEALEPETTPAPPPANENLGPLAGLLQKSSVGIFPSREQINRDAIIIALRSKMGLFSSLETFDDYIRQPQNAQTVNDLITGAIDMIRSYEAASEFNSNLSHENWIKSLQRSCIYSNACKEASLTDQSRLLTQQPA